MTKRPTLRSVEAGKPLADDKFRPQPEPAQVDLDAVRELSDERLLYYFDRIHHPSVVAPRWTYALQDEVIRRGLRKPS